MPPTCQTRLQREVDMQFESFAEFVAMGRHGIFVWSSYAAFVAILAINVVLPVMQRKALMTRLRRVERRSSSTSAVPEQSGE